jgi:PAS domain S-box-containing protein
LLDYAQDKIALLDADGTFTYVNGAADQILGYRPAALIGQNAFDLIHPDDREAVMETFQSVIETGEDFTQNTARYRFRASDDSWVWLESRMSNLTDAALDGYVVSSRDITDRVEAERERDESRRRLQEIAANTTDVLWMFSGDWEEVLFVNQAYEETYGMSVEELTGSPERFLDCIHHADVPAVEDAMERLSNGESVDMEYRVDPSKEFNRYVWVQAEPIVEDGEVIRIVGFTRDVTDRRRRERQLTVMDNLLRHNLRNEMNVILGQAELITESDGDCIEGQTAVIRRVGENLLATADKQRQIIDLLQRPVTAVELNLSTVVDGAVGTVRQRYRAHDITIDIEPLTVRAIAELEAAVLELLENSIEHATGEPAIHIATSTDTGDPETVALVIRDSDPPIPEFEYRVLTGEHEMSHIYHSSGLGLWLVYWIVELSEGNIDFVPTETGNEITIRLPRAE